MPLWPWYSPQFTRRHHTDRPRSLPCGRPGTERGRLGSNRPYVTYDFSGPPWRWLHWRHTVPVAPMGNYLAQKPTLYVHRVT
eukprot:5307306-Prymnesium_polylepis.1